MRFRTVCYNDSLHLPSVVELKTSNAGLVHNDEIGRVLQLYLKHVPVWKIGCYILQKSSIFPDQIVELFGEDFHHKLAILVREDHYEIQRKSD